MSLITDALKAAKAALKAEAHTAARGTEAASILTKKAKEVPPPSPRAKPKTKQEISEIAERVAPQLQGEFVRGAKGTTNVAGKSRKQFDLEQQLEHDLRRSREVPEAQPVDLSERKGSVMLSLPGDFTIADQDLFRVGDVQLREPSRQYGGPRYGLGHPEEAGWASGLSAAGKFQRGVTEASQQYGDAPVLANYMMMGPEGINYALHFADANLKAIDTTKMTKRNIRDFNSIIRKGHPKMKFPEFAGIENPDLAYEQMAADPELRKHFNAIMQMPTVSEAFKMPSGLNIRHAVTEPELRNLERGMTGFSLMEMEPGVASLKVSKHPTYSHDIPGTFLGKTDVPIPYELTFPDTVAQIRENPRQAPYEFGTLQFSGGRQMIDQQLIDEIGEYRRRIKELTGKKAGGLAMADGGQAFPLQPEFEAEVERLRSRPRTRAGVPVEDTNVLGGALQGLANMLGGAAFGRLVGTAGAPADILEPMAAPGATIPMFGMAAMPTEISKALVQRFAPKGPDIPVPTSEFLLEKGLEKFKPAQEFEQAAKIGRFAPFDIAEMQAAGRKLKALQPALGELLEAQMKPYQMGVAPEGKLSKEEYSRMMREKYAAQNLAQQEKKATAADLKPQEVKVPADELGFYSPAEKAAANLKRNIGTGEAFLSDLKKAPDVGETDLIHTGLENWLKNKKTVSKQEIQDYMTANRLKFQKEELRAGEGNPEDLRFRGGEAIHDEGYINAEADYYINDWDSLGYRTREEIRNEKLRQYTPEEAEPLINSGQLDEMVDKEIRDLAYKLSEDQYYDNPYREWNNELGYTIFGNDDVGYSIRSPNGDDITPNRGVYDFETAEGTVQQHAMDNGYVSEDGTQYHDYQLEGPSTNYREHLTRLDRGKSRGDLQQELADVRRAMDDPLDQQEYNALAKRRDELEDELSQHHKPYESSHWSGDDVVSHSRTQDRVDVEGKDTLHIDELQSDWHQDGAEFGYADKATRQQYKDLMRERAGLAADFTALRDEISVLSHRAYHNDTMKQHAGYEPFPEVRAKLDEANQKSKATADKIDEINMRLSDIERAVPDAPFKKDWVEKELKKLLKVAAEEGKERITLSRWQDQLRRWGTDSIGFKKTSDGVWSVTATKNRRLLPGDLDDTVTADEIYYKTSIRGGESPVTSKSELRKIVKMDLSKGWSNAHIDRVTNKVWDQMNKLQIDEVGAIDPRKEGFKATYGKSFIDTMQKLAKKLGAKTGTTELNLGSGEYIQVPYIEVSGKAKQSAIKGQPYKTGGAVRKADGGAVHPAVEKFAASLPHPAVTEFVAKLADGGGVWKAMVDGKYNTVPDVSDAERVIQGPAFAEGGGVWKQLVEGAGNA